MATAGGEASISTGYQTRALGNYSVAAGSYTTASNTYAVAMGNQSSASGEAAFSMGSNCAAQGPQSAAFGKTMFTRAAHSFVVGSYNESSDFPDPQNPAATDRIFQIGNGDNSTRSNAITILRNGNMGIGSTTPVFPLNFANNLGHQISLWGNSGNHYGFGIQGGLLQMHSAGSGDDIAFGYGSSASFTEGMRIKGNGKLGIGTSNPFNQTEIVGAASATPVTLTIGNRGGFGPWPWSL
ncbi:MAG: hypothetical protein IPP48_02515 [Chitinophagaceae bacterium]|nr:hypothetical protein [Chitinophagaceae bacterium]